MKKPDKVMEVMAERKSLGGWTYETGCGGCQGKGSGLINMIPLPTHRTACYNEEDEEWVFNYICRDCAKHCPPFLKFVWVDKLPIYPDDLAVTEIPKELNEEGKEAWCDDRKIHKEEYD